MNRKLKSIKTLFSGMLLAMALLVPLASVKAGDLFVTDYTGRNILRFDAATGQPKGIFIPGGEGGLNTPYGIAFGPDGNLYAANDVPNTNCHPDIDCIGDNILRFDGVSGESLLALVSDDGRFGLDQPKFLAFSPEGILYVSSFNNQSEAYEIRKYDGVTGNFIGTFPTGISQPTGIAFGPEGSLYVGSQTENNVYRFNTSNGGNLGKVFTQPPSPILQQPVGLSFGSDGLLYIAGRSSNNVVRVNTENRNATIAFYITDPVSIASGPDGNLYVGSLIGGNIHQFNLTTNEKKIFVAKGTGGLNAPLALAFSPPPPPAPGTEDPEQGEEVSGDQNQPGGMSGENPTAGGCSVQSATPSQGSVLAIFFLLPLFVLLLKKFKKETI